MKRSLLTTATAVAMFTLAQPSWAIGTYDEWNPPPPPPVHNSNTNTNTNTSNSTANSKSVSSSESKAAAHSSSNARATGGNATATGGNPSARSTARGGAGGQGGMGGNVTNNITVPSSGSDPSTASLGRSGVGDPNAGGPTGSYNTNVAASPSLAVAPASGAASVSCAQRGFGAGGSSGGPSGLLVFTWADEHCVNMVAFEALRAMGHDLAALYVINEDNPTVARALKWEAEHRPQPVAIAAPEPVAVHDPNFLGELCAEVPAMCDAE